MNEHASHQVSASAAMAELTDMIVDQITKLGALRDSGLLTEEEFAAKKSELMARL